MDRLTWWLNLCFGAMAASGAADDATFCPSDAQCANGECGDPEQPACITFEEAAERAAQPDSGIHRLAVKGEPALGGLVHASAENENAICSGDTCYVKGDGKVALAAYGHQTVFFGWEGCSESREPHIVVGPLGADTDCAAHFGPGLIVVHAQVAGRDDVSIQISGSCTGEDHCTFLNGGSVTLSAPASDARYTFLGWSGCSTSTEPTISFTDVQQALAECVAQYAPKPIY